MEEYGYVQTVVGIVQLFGGLVSGPLMDVYGPKLVLLLSYGTSAASYALTGMAHSMTLIYISRLPTLLQHAVMATRTAVGEGSSEADRARLLGYVGVAYGVGMAAGPIIGGYLAKHDLRLSAWVATAGSVFSLSAQQDASCPPSHTVPLGCLRPPHQSSRFQPHISTLAAQSRFSSSTAIRPRPQPSRGRRPRAQRRSRRAPVPHLPSDLLSPPPIGCSSHAHRRY